MAVTMKIVALTLLGLGLLSVGVESQDECKLAAKSLTPRHFLNLTEFLGTWYVQKFGMGDVEDYYFMPDYSCLAVDYSIKSGNNTLRVEERYLENINGNITEVTATNDAVIGDLLAPAIMTMYSNRTGTGEPVTTETVIFASNPASFAIQYSCSIQNGRKRESGTVMTRKRAYGTRLPIFLDSLLEGLGFTDNLFIPIGQTECDH